MKTSHHLSSSTKTLNSPDNSLHFSIIHLQWLHSPWSPCLSSPPSTNEGRLVRRQNSGLMTSTHTWIFHFTVTFFARACALFPLSGWDCIWTPTSQSLATLLWLLVFSDLGPRRLRSHCVVEDSPTKANGHPAAYRLLAGRSLPWCVHTCSQRAEGQDLMTDSRLWVFLMQFFNNHEKIATNTSNRKFAINHVSWANLRGPCQFKVQMGRNITHESRKSELSFPSSFVAGISNPVFLKGFSSFGPSPSLFPAALCVPGLSPHTGLGLTHVPGHALLAWLEWRRACSISLLHCSFLVLDPAVTRYSISSLVLSSLWLERITLPWTRYFTSAFAVWLSLVTCK